MIATRRHAGSAPAAIIRDAMAGTTGSMTSLLSGEEMTV
jgi:hypothetical protein